MSKSIELTLENFEAEVVVASQERPVVIDFWAEWCAPCKQLTPILEKLSQEMNFVLARIDVEKNQQLASYFQVQSIPDVRVVSKGRIADTIQGVLPEAQLRKKLSRHFLSPEALALLEADQLVQQGQPEAALELLAPLLAHAPNDRKVQYCQAKALVDLRRSDEAKGILEQFREGDDFYRDAKSLLELMAFHVILAAPATDDPIEAIYRASCQHALDGNATMALEGFLEILKTQKNWQDDAARKAMLTLFGVLGPKHELTWTYRSKLNTLLFV